MPINSNLNYVTVNITIIFIPKMTHLKEITIQHINSIFYVKTSIKINYISYVNTNKSLFI